MQPRFIDIVILFSRRGRRRREARHRAFEQNLAPFIAERSCETETPIRACPGWHPFNPCRCTPYQKRWNPPPLYPHRRATGPGSPRTPAPPEARTTNRLIRLYKHGHSKTATQHDFREKQRNMSTGSSKVAPGGDEMEPHTPSKRRGSYIEMHAEITDTNRKKENQDAQVRDRGRRGEGGDQLLQRATWTEPLKINQTDRARPTQRGRVDGPLWRL